MFNFDDKKNEYMYKEEKNCSVPRMLVPKSSKKSTTGAARRPHSGVRGELGVASPVDEEKGGAGKDKQQAV